MANVWDAATRADGIEAAGDEDPYDELEDWYSESFPRLHSAQSLILSKPPGEQSEGHSSRDPQTAHWTHNEAEGEEPSGVEDYEIEIEAEVASELASVDDPQTEEPHPNDGDDDDNDDALLEFVPKKLFARRTAATDSRGGPDRLPRCCDHCHSDLNGKLLVKCAACSFKRHLYCFSPPLKQHPALISLAHVPRHKRLPISKLMAQWRCETCVARMGGPPSPELKTVAVRVEPTAVPSKKRQKPPTRSPVKDKQPSAAPANRKFDWYAFRAEKFEKVLGSDREEEAGTQNLRNELAFYEPSEALLKKTALFWQQQVLKHKQLRAEHAARVLKCRVPVKRPLRVELSPREAAEVADSNQKHQTREREEHAALFDDTNFYSFDDPRPIFQTLRRPAPRSASAVGRDGLTEEEREALEKEDREREAQESDLMAAEDDDAPTPAQAARLARRRAQAASITKDPSLLGLYLAAKIIERTYFGWLKRARSRIRHRVDAEKERHELELMRAEEGEGRRRRARAQALNARLRYQIKFILVIVRAQRRLQLKKEMLLLLKDAQEDGQIRAQGAEAEESRCRRLAEKRIQRFFLRRVRRYIQIRKRMMVRRLIKWWKHKHYPFKFRILATTVRLRHRDRAAMKIQRAFCQYCTYKAFKTLRDKLVMRKLRRLLSNWLMKRLIRKEQERVAVYNASLAVGVALVDENATVGEIIKAMGLFLYERSDFWNGAAILERVTRLRKDLMDTETQFVLAYCHHMAWYASCSSYNLSRSIELYRSILSVRGRPADPFVLQELALVLMHDEDFRGSLSILARLIELFRDDDGFPLWLLLAGVQLQQVGRWNQSVEYLRYLSDLALPSPYEERDVLALCAMSYEKAGGSEASGSAKEAWRAAIRLWTMEKKLVSVHHHGNETMSYAPNGSTTKKDDRSRLSRLRKWELLVDLAQRANGAGHYLVSCRALLYALEKLAFGDNGDLAWEYEQQRAWWALGDTFRHLGKLDLYVEATARSRQTRTTCEEEEKDRRQWRAQAETQAKGFENELKTVSVRQHADQIRAQYEGTAQSLVGNDLSLEDYS